MVCKEDVLTWFKNLDSYQRIDLMFELLNMCVPFELRFLGSCIEEIGKHSYQELRGPTITANDIEKLSKDNSLVQTHALFDELVRHRALIYISLLSARNYSCATWFYKNLFISNNIDEYVVKEKCKDESVLKEFLLLFTMALHHPAFTFEQKNHFGNLVAQIVELKDGIKELSPKSCNYYYPPGFGYPTLSKMPLPADIPVKSASVVSIGDTSPIIHKYPTHSLMMSHHMDFIAPTGWPRAAYPTTVCPNPEVPLHPPPPPTSPLVTHTGSPASSRATSPQRTTFSIRPLNMIHPSSGQTVEVVTSQHPQIDTLSQPSSSLPAFIPDVKSSEEDINHATDDKNRENAWTNQVPFEFNPQNGIRFPYCKFPSLYFLQEPFQSLSLEGDNSLHCSSSSSRSGTPPETPVTPAVIPQGPGRGDTKTRVNGLPPFMNNPPQLCDASKPPPPLQSFSNCSVPYSTYPTMSAMRNRFNYSQCRFPYSANFTYPPADSYPSYHYPITTPQPVPRNIYCFNCGSNSHTGAECSGQTIEDITQKPYVLEYNPSLSDMDKT